MTGLFYAALVALSVFVLVYLFANARPERVAQALRIAGPAALAIMGLVLLLLARFGIAFLFFAMAYSLYARLRGTSPIATGGPRRSHVRSAALEMELDHETGDMNGIVLAGRFEGRELDRLSFDELLALAADLTADTESLQLLEAYLDRKHAGWRDRADAADGPGLGGTPRPGTMTEKEAYDILGLEPGASAAEIRKAHRRLMQRAHPDVGGSAELAARINAAKDLLLSRHR